MRIRWIAITLAAGLVASAPAVMGQRLNKCPDGKGGVVFQQEKCGETAEQAEARMKEKARADAQAQQRKEEEARRREESMRRARERDRAYEQQQAERAEAERKARAAEQRLMQGTGKAREVDDGSLPPQYAQSHPGAWKEAPDPAITAALVKNRTPACDHYRYRQRAGGLPEYLVQCTADKSNWVTYFVWPRADTVRGPARF